MFKSTILRFQNKTVKDGECLRWIGSICSSGYGQISIDGRMVMAHRFSYEYHVRSLVPGEQLDHLCRNRWCVNHEHLEPVSSRENTRRGNNFVSEYMSRDHCSSGHKYTPENLTYRPSGARVCRECARERNRRYSKRRKSES